MTAPIKLFYWPTPNGKKITIALHEMNIPYELNLVNIGKGEQFQPDFLRISPNNRMPAIIDPDGPDGEPISVFESGAILQYLARKSGRFYGSSERERVQIEEWLFWQVGGVGPMAGQAHHFLRYAPAMDPPQDLSYAKVRYRGEVGAALRRARSPAQVSRLRRGGVFDRRHGDLALGEWLEEPAAGHRAVSAHGGLARARRVASGGRWPGRASPSIAAPT